MSEEYIHGCWVSEFSSRVCEVGTKCCTREHPLRVDSEHAAQSCMCRVCLAYDEGVHDTQADLATLRAENERQKEALTLAKRWLGTMDPHENFEDIAEWFYQETGIMRPGKDAPMASYGPSGRLRREAFDEWCEKKGADVRAKIAEALGVPAPSVCVASTEVVSPPGARVTETVVTLTSEAQAKLVISDAAWRGLNR